MRVRLLGLVALMALVLASCGGNPPEAGRSAEGIQVHGDWTIDIYNEDGSLDRHLEFSNALSEPGADSLVQLLLGTGPADADSWFISVTNACPTGCVTTDVSVEGLHASGSSNLVEVISLGGEVVAANDATIDRVTTGFGICTDDVTTSACNGSLTVGDSRPFTFKDLDPADQVDVTTGQTIQLQVEISFTSG